jgi:hypothetical protein
MGKYHRKTRRPRQASEGLVVARLDAEELRRLYIEMKLTMTVIAQRHGCSKQYVSVLCKRYGIRRER